MPRSERVFLRSETKRAEQRLERTLAYIPDAPAQSIADLLGTTPLRVQRELVMLTSSVFQMVKLACLFFGFYLWPTKVPSRPITPVGGHSGGGGGLKLVAATTGREQVATAKRSATSSATRGRRSATPTGRMGDKELELLLRKYRSGGMPGRSLREVARRAGRSYSTV